MRGFPEEKGTESKAPVDEKGDAEGGREPGSPAVAMAGGEGSEAEGDGEEGVIRKRFLAQSLFSLLDTRWGQPFSETSPWRMITRETVFPHEKCAVASSK